jgi:hypothetical protein
VPNVPSALEFGIQFGKPLPAHFGLQSAQDVPEKFVEFVSHGSGGRFRSGAFYPMRAL